MSELGSAPSNQPLDIFRGGTGNEATYTDGKFLYFNSGAQKIQSSAYDNSSFADASHSHSASDVTDFDTEVSNNTDVSANTSARHTQNTDTGTTSQTFQLHTGSSGPKLKNSGGTFEVRNAADDAYANLACLDATINGDLTVLGDTVTMQTADLLVEDRYIELNYGFAGSPTLDSGILLNRGASTDAMLIWDETSDTFKCGVSGSLAEIRTGTVGVTVGGTGLTSIAQGSILYASSANTLSALSITGTSGSYLKSNGTTVEWWNIPDDDFHVTLATEANADNDDELLIWDNTASAYKRQSRSNFLSGVGGNPAGTGNEVQYRVDGTTFGGDADFQFASDVLTLNGTLTPGATNNLVVKMGNNNGSTKVSFTDSGDAEVASIDDDGKITAVQFLLGTRQDYTVSNGSTDRTIDCNNTTINELADVLGTVISDLITAGIFQ